MREQKGTERKFGGSSCFTMLSSGVRKVIQIHTHTHTHYFPYRLLQNIEYSSLHYVIGPCWLTILYIKVCIY